MGFAVGALPRHIFGEVALRVLRGLRPDLRLSLGLQLCVLAACCSSQRYSALMQ